MNDSAALPQTPEPFWRDLLLGYFLLGLQPATVAALTAGSLTPSGAVFLRFLFSAAAILPICLVRRRGLVTKNWKLLVLRGVFGGGAVILYFTSVALAGAGRATILNYTYPLWANVFAFLLGARPSRRVWIGLLVAGFGVWLIVVPGGSSPIGAVGPGEWAGIVSAMFAGISVLLIKKLRETDESLTILAGFTAGGLLVSLPDAQVGASIASLAVPSVMFAAWGVGLTSFLGHFYFTRGYGGATLQQATLLSLMVPAIAAFCGILFFEEPLTLSFVLGAVLVAGALVWGARSSAKPS